MSSVQRIKPLGLLRTLLREASYLPDAHARTYFRQYIVNRFKAYQPKENATASFDVHAVQKYRHRSFKRRQVAIIRERTRPLLRKGQKGLNFLRRANQGELHCLEKVLWFAYGRVGRRKYALLNDLLKPDPAMAKDTTLAGTDKIAPLQALYRSNKRYLQFFDAPEAQTNRKYHVIGISDRYARLRVVIKSQYNNGACIQRKLKNFELKTPINNIWTRPMPIKRARNIVKRWYAETLTGLLPPLPDEEWDNMHAMAVGTQPVSIVKPRVPAMQHLEPSPDQSELQLMEMLKAGLTLNKPSKADKPAGMNRPHHITPRFMRRLYTKLLPLCCKVEYDDSQKRWRAIWGETSKAINPRLYSVAGTDESLFAGVDATGRIPQIPKPKINRDASTRPENQQGDYIQIPFFAEQLPKAHPIHKSLIEWKAKIARAKTEAGTEAEKDRGR